MVVYLLHYFPVLKEYKGITVLYNIRAKYFKFLESITSENEIKYTVQCKHHFY